MLQIFFKHTSLIPVHMSIVPMMTKAAAHGSITMPYIVWRARNAGRLPCPPKYKAWKHRRRWYKEVTIYLLSLTNVGYHTDLEHTLCRRNSQQSLDDKLQLILNKQTDENPHLFLLRRISSQSKYQMIASSACYNTFEYDWLFQ